MFALRFNGRFELNDPEEFLNELKELLLKQHAEYFGNIQTEDLGRYVDFQKIEETPIAETKHE